MTRPLVEKVADELDRLYRDVERIGLQLCSDPDLLSRHACVLQSFDEMGQRQQELAMLLRSGDDRAIGQVKLASLLARLQAA